MGDHHLLVLRGILTVARERVGDRHGALLLRLGFRAGGQVDTLGEIGVGFGAPAHEVEQRAEGIVQRQEIGGACERFLVNGEGVIEFALADQRLSGPRGFG